MWRSSENGRRLRTARRLDRSRSFIDDVDSGRSVSIKKSVTDSGRTNLSWICLSNPESGDSVSSESHILQNQDQFVNWFRETWPYIHRHRGSTFVIVIPGEVIAKRYVLDSILQDISLLHGLGIKLVVIPGSQIQIDELLREKNREPKYVGAYRVTDAHALEACKEAAGRIHVDIEAKLSRGPSIVPLRRHGENGRWHEAGGIVSSGNLVSAKRRGVVNGTDFGATGEVKKIEVARIKEALDKNNIVLLSNLGYSKSGEVLNCNTYEVATACAIALQADKLLCLLNGTILNENNQPLRHITIQEADQMIRKRAEASPSCAARDYVEVVAGLDYLKRLGLDKLFSGEQSVTPRSLSSFNVNGFEQNTCFQIDANSSVNTEGSLNANYIKTKGQGFAIGGEERLSRTYGYLSELTAAAFACRGGVRRVQLVDATVEGALLLELYSRDGVGAMVSSDKDYIIRPAMAGDFPRIKYLLQPLVESGTLVNRPSDQLLEELLSFTVVEKDGILIACSALFPYNNEKCGEVAAFVVAKEWRGRGVGDDLLDYLEKKAAKLGLDRIFLLTTRTADWFVHHGFLSCNIDLIPEKKQMSIDLARGSKYYIKYLLSGIQEAPYGMEHELSIY
ncbi:hypothetical protein O6H91_19G080400 [Diphasiastrum complanatum]|nr:hypothetical protein O6H91_19G080400 [Diphasiastrum complanatum]